MNFYQLGFFFSNNILKKFDELNFFSITEYM